MTDLMPEAQDLASRLRARRVAAWGEFREIIHAAETAGRPLSGPERDRCDDLEEEMAKLDRRIRAVLDTDTFFDAGNTLLSQVTCQLHTGTISEEGQGPRGVVTVRTASTTVSVVLGPGDLAVWLDILSGLHKGLLTAQPGGAAIPDKRSHAVGDNPMGFGDPAGQRRA